jgi:hypothetical protein
MVAKSSFYHGPAARCYRPAVVQDTLLGSLATQLTLPEHEIVSIYHTRLEHGYPTPHLERNAVLAEALPWLQQYDIWSRGRFGSYKVGGGGTVVVDDWWDLQGRL